MSEWTEQNERDSKIYQEGFDDGYDACLIEFEKWHDYNELPCCDGERIVVLTHSYSDVDGYTDYDIAFYSASDGRWLLRKSDSASAFYRVVAWKEIEPFE